MHKYICDMCHTEISHSLYVYTTKNILKSHALWTNILLGIYNERGYLDDNIVTAIIGELGSKDDLWPICEECQIIISQESISAEYDLNNIKNERLSFCEKKGPLAFSIHDFESWNNAKEVAFFVAETISSNPENLPREETRNNKIKIDIESLKASTGSQDALFLTQGRWNDSDKDECCIVIRDQTPFMNRLKNVKPFRLFTQSGLVRTSHGNLIISLFWVLDGKDSLISIWDWFPSFEHPYFYEILIKMSFQEKIYLILIGANNVQEKIFEFQNTFDFLSVLKLTCQGPFIKTQKVLQLAILEYQSKYTLREIYEAFKKNQCYLC